MKDDIRVEPTDNSKFGSKAHFGGVDSSQILPQKNPDVKIPFRPPLHIPKNQSPIKDRPQTAPLKKKDGPYPEEPYNQFVDDEPANEDQEDPKDLVDQQLNDMNDRIDERDPKLYVDVNIGKNGMERITVYDGDTAESLAEQFCQKHQLGDDMKDKLKTLLDQ